MHILLAKVEAERRRRQNERRYEFFINPANWPALRDWIEEPPVNTEFKRRFKVLLERWQRALDAGEYDLDTRTGERE